MTLAAPWFYYFLPYQRRWVLDASPLKLMEKSRQVGISFTDAYDSVRKVASQGARLDVWVSSRDETQARLYLQDCANWARLLHRTARLVGDTVFRDENDFSARALEFANGRRIYSLSSNPNALAGKRGHVKLDEFALHQDQRLLYSVAKPVTTWGGQLCIISTHRGAGSVFNQLVRDAREGGNPMGWSLHSVPLATAVEQGLVERINAKTGRNESREGLLKRLRAECIDEEQWLQEYCCVPADDAAAFITYELIDACTDPGCLRDLAYLCSCPNPLFLGVDVARHTDLCVLDVGERIGEIVWDRLRIELVNRPFGEIEAELYRLLKIPRLRRACIDATGMGLQLAERARARFGPKVEPVTFTAALKEELACGLRMDFQNQHLRLPPDAALAADLRGLRATVTTAGHIRYQGESPDSHCDRFWAKALRQHAARLRVQVGAVVG